MIKFTIETVIDSSLIIPSLERARHPTEITPARVTQKETYINDEKRFGALHAVDRDLSTQAITSNGAGPWLKLGFEKTKFIHEVIVHYRFYTNWYNQAEHCAKDEEKFRGCVANDNNVDVSVYQGEVKQKSCGTLQLTTDLEQSDQIYTLLCNAEGDTVKLSKSTATPIAVCEVVVTSTGNNLLRF